ncbi:MAG TPA: TetR/AcrR family transcriptional regulator [Pseudonocardia sp.]|nr:TetR/AcrR family transcriptional regulator [Pseudonocardia sp.]
MTAQRGAPRLRADAARNVEAILDAALTLFAESTHPSMERIAKAAGVGRVTLYSHFASRELLLTAALDRALSQAGEAIRGAEPERGTADAALGRLIAVAWDALHRHRRVFELAERQLDTRARWERHATTLAPITEVIERGRRDGEFRRDLPASWLVTTFYALLHAAAESVRSGDLPPAGVADLITATLQPAFATTTGTFAGAGTTAATEPHGRTRASSGRR